MVAPPPSSTYRPPWLRPAAGRTLAVVGADGFIGSHVVRLALAAGAGVVGVCVKQPWRLRDVGGARLVGLPRERWWEATTAEGLGPLLADADALVVLAYEPPPPGVSTPERLEHERAVNRAGARSLARLAASLPVPVLFASSADVYGPLHEAPVREETRPRPASPYARAKLEAEGDLADALAGSAPCVSLRIGTVYGPGENGPRAIPSFVRALASRRRPIVHGDGSDVRDYVHVCDVAAAIVNLCAAPPRGDEALVLNVASGTGRTTLEALSAVARALGRDARPLHLPAARPPSRLVLDVARARRLALLDPREDFANAVAEEAGWLLRHLKTGPEGRREVVRAGADASPPTP